MGEVGIVGAKLEGSAGVGGAPIVGNGGAAGEGTGGALGAPSLLKVGIEGAAALCLFFILELISSRKEFPVVAGKGGAADDGALAGA